MNIIPWRRRELHPVKFPDDLLSRFFRNGDLARTRPDDISAVYKRGVLTIDVRKVEKTPAAKIPVQAG
jgi:HSP20 family molecular chaperone IbpA